MKFIDYLKFALNNLTTRGLRSWLTVIGVVIGVAAIVAIVSIGQGMQEVISMQMGALGSDQVYVMAGSTFSGGMFEAAESGELDERDLKVIKSVEGVIAASPDIMGFADVTYGRDTSHLYVMGVDENWEIVRGATIGIESGRFLAKGDRGVAVLGYKVAKEAFDKEVYVGSQIKIENKSYNVIGILKEFGGFTGSGEDTSVYLSLEDAEQYAGGFGTKKYYAIEIKVEQERTDEIAEKIKEKLLISRQVTEDKMDFTVYTPKMITETVLNILNTINLFLYGIAAISLIVGAVGIANTMFTSVLERTRQIGVLKSVGMTNKEVLNLFLIEAGLIGLVGGILGIFVGLIISGTIGQIAAFFLKGTSTSIMGSAGTTSMVSITPQLIIFALLFSVIIGVVSGIWPAKRASKLEPVVALRYE